MKTRRPVRAFFGIAEPADIGGGGQAAANPFRAPRCEIDRRYNALRFGFSLLEMMVATTIMATLMASVVVVLRSGYSVWNAQEADIDTLENAYGVLRHFTQQMRQAKSVTAISDASNSTGGLSFLTESGDTRSWTHNGAQKEVTFNNGVGTGLLAKSIDAVWFTGYEADGVTQTTTVDEIQAVRCAVQVTLPRGAGVTRTVSCRAWIRSW